MKTIPGLYSVVAASLLAQAATAAAHWPGQPPHQMAQLGDLQLEGGGVIPNFKMSYVTHGTLNAYTRWREANPEDTLRFHTLRLREGGMVKSSPQRLLAQGTDWRFLNELKKELKG